MDILQDVSNLVEVLKVILTEMDLLIRSQLEVEKHIMEL